VAKHPHVANQNKTRGIVMAEDTLAERDPAFNQSSNSSHSHSALQPESIAKLESMALLLAKAESLSSVALRDAFLDSSIPERHHYLVALNDLLVAACEKLSGVLAAARQRQVKE
jgi:hypothetical protein